jgi:hypothetical protein
MGSKPINIEAAAPQSTSFDVDGPRHFRKYNDVVRMAPRQAHVTITLP